MKDPTIVRILFWDDNYRDWDELGLSHFWEGYGEIGGFDHAFPVKSWADVRQILAGMQLAGRVVQIHVAGHGRQGQALLGNTIMDERSLAAALVGVLAGSYLWLRCCDSFGGLAGHRFARRLAAAMPSTVAVYGHTRVISQAAGGVKGAAGWLVDAAGIALGWFWQSGGHGIRGGQEPLDEPYWPTTESGWSAPWKGHTVPLTAQNPPAKWLQPRRS